MDEGWKVYRENQFPRRAALFQRTVGSAVALEIDWDSLGECSQPRMERLDYDLEMLARGIEQALRNLSPDSAPAISQLAVRWVDGIDACVFNLESGRLQVSYCAHGAFSAEEVEALLSAVDLQDYERQVTPAPGDLSPALQDLRKHRLPALFRRVRKALGKPLPMELDWASFGHGYEVPPRLLYLLKETTSALRELANEEPGMTVGPPEVHARAKELAQARANGARKGLTGLRIAGAMQGHCPPVEVQQGIVRLNVFIDPTTSTQGRLRPDYDLRVVDACRHAAIQNVIADALGLRVKPFLEQIRNEHIPRLQTSLIRILDNALTQARGLKVPVRATLRSILESRPPRVVVDLDSFANGPTADASLSALKSLETGHYNYNSETGPFGLQFFQALESCMSDWELLRVFIEHVREIRLQCVVTLEQVEFSAASGLLSLKQCPFERGGMLDEDLSERLKALLAMLESGALAPANDRPDESALESQFAQLGAQLKEAFGTQLTFEFDPAICTSAADAHALSQRGILPVLGAVKLLLAKPDFALDLSGTLVRLRVMRGLTADARVAQDELILQTAPEVGPAGWPDAVRIAAALNDGLALQARAEIRERERESRASWQEMLSERFGRNILLNIQWDSFIVHPREGGNRFQPFHLEDGGIRPLLNALTSYMDEDPAYRKRAKKSIQEIRISCAESTRETALTLSDGVLHYRCFSDNSRQGYMPTALIQERLYALAFPASGR